MKTGALFSGGKDSAYAIYWALNQAWNVNCLINIKTENPHSFMFHHPNQKLIELQAKKAGIPLIQLETPGEKEEELEALEKAVKKAKKEFDPDAVISGAVASSYQKKRVDNICHKQEIKSFAPLWTKKQNTLMQYILKADFDVRISAVAAEGLTKDWLGKKITEETVQELKEMKGMNIAGEGGEWESTVLNAPFFKEKIVVKKARKEWKKNRGNWIIEEAR